MATLDDYEVQYHIEEKRGSVDTMVRVFAPPKNIARSLMPQTQEWYSYQGVNYYLNSRRFELDWPGRPGTNTATNTAVSRITLRYEQSPQPTAQQPIRGTMFMEITEQAVRAKTGWIDDDHALEKQVPVYGRDGGNYPDGDDRQNYIKWGVYWEVVQGSGLKYVPQQIFRVSAIAIPGFDDTLYDEFINSVNNAETFGRAAEGTLRFMGIKARTPGVPSSYSGGFWRGDLFFMYRAQGPQKLGWNFETRSQAFMRFTARDRIWDPHGLDLQADSYVATQVKRPVIPEDPADETADLTKSSNERRELYEPMDYTIFEAIL